jgi:hypothetical protein
LCHTGVKGWDGRLVLQRVCLELTCWHWCVWWCYGQHPRRQQVHVLQGHAQVQFTAAGATASIYQPKNCCRGRPPAPAAGATASSLHCLQLSAPCFEHAGATASVRGCLPAFALPWGLKQLVRRPAFGRCVYLGRYLVTRHAAQDVGSAQVCMRRCGARPASPRHVVRTTGVV